MTFTTSDTTNPLAPLFQRFAGDVPTGGEVNKATFIGRVKRHVDVTKQGGRALLQALQAFVFQGVRREEDGRVIIFD